VNRYAIDGNIYEPSKTSDRPVHPDPQPELLTADIPALSGEVTDTTTTGNSVEVGIATTDNEPYPETATPVEPVPGPSTIATHALSGEYANTTVTSTGMQLGLTLLLQKMTLIQKQPDQLSQFHGHLRWLQIKQIKVRLLFLGVLASYDTR